MEGWFFLCFFLSTKSSIPKGSISQSCLFHSIISLKLCSSKRIELPLSFQESIVQNNHRSFNLPTTEAFRCCQSPAITNTLQCISLYTCPFAQVEFLG